MREFKINKDLSIKCEWKKTRSAFKHEAVLLRNGEQVDQVKICYLNRTWERYEFQSVLQKMIGSNELTEKEKKQGSKMIENNGEAQDPVLKSLKMFSALADVMQPDEKKRNESKARMLETATGGAVRMPCNWSELPEKEKTRRLKGAIETL